jgi:ATP-binding cassette subfamily F protein 3
MISLSAAGKRFGPKILFQGLDWLITPQDRIGLVGANGSGKTTLLKILGGIESLDYGTISFQKGISLGYLPQDGLRLSGRTVFNECLSVFDELRDIEREMETLSHAMGEIDHESAEFEQIADRYHQIEHRFRSMDGYSLEAQVGTVLTGLGFKKEDWSRLTDEFSGGWQMRIALAKLLLQKPSALLLDEPTNHLDLETRNWLESYLLSYPNAYIVISHDRYFLDVTVDRIVEIWNKGVHFYPGNYEKYLAQKQQRRESLEAAYRNQRERIEQLEAFINRFRAQATKAKQVQSRIKELEKIERIEVPPDEKAIHFKFPQPPASGRTVAEFKNVSKSYGEKEVLRNVNFVIERADRVALVGVNGAGKSTLIRMLSGEERLTSGEFHLGHNVQADYFAQDQYKVLDPTARMLDDIWTVAPQKTQTDLRSLLGCFLFSEDDVFKQIGVLSGGERNRYALARMLLHPANFLLLDEPTNHLDLRAKDVLLESLQNFTGTVVFVSHDRYFIDKLATRVFEIADGNVNIFPGNYEDYLWRKEGKQGSEPTLDDVPGAKKASSNRDSRQSGSSRDGGRPVLSAAVADTLGSADTSGNGDGADGSSSKKRVNPIKLKQMQDRCTFVEEEIARLETTIADTETALQSFVSVDETQRLTSQLDAHRRELASLMSEWEELSHTIEANA